MARLMRLLICVLCLSTLAFGTTGKAQVSLTGSSSESTTEVDLSDPLTPEDARALVSTLSDTEVRKLLLERLDAVAEEAAASDAATEELGSFTSVAFGSVGASVSAAIGKLPELGTILSNAWSTFLEITGPNGLAFLILVMSVTIALAVVIELLFRRAIRSWVEKIDTSERDPSLRQTLNFLVKRLTADGVAVLIFFVAATTLGPVVGNTLGPMMLESWEQGARIVPFIAPIWMNLIVLPRVAAAVARFVLAPHRPAYRLVNLDDQTAHRLYRHQIVAALLFGLLFWAPSFLAMTSESWGSSRLGFWINTALHLYVIYIAYSCRAGFTMMMRGPDDDVTPAEDWSARAYPWFIVIMTALTWWIVEILAGYGRFDLLAGLPHIWMLILISFAPTMDTVVRGLVRHLMPPMTGEGALAERAYTATRRSYIRIGRVIVFALVVMAIANIWRIDMTNLAAASVGIQLAGRLLELLMILAVGYLVYEVVSLWINRKLAAEQTAAGVDLNAEEPGGGEGGGAGGSRLSTVLPLILATARVVIVVVFALLGLSNIGIDTTPLLAGAGIVGLAVGFGAQKLVTDVVSGVFFLIDDAFRTGEYVEVDGTMGTVEKISIRSMQLRHHKGPVHTIPYGEIPKLTNYSRDWVIMKLRFTVPFDTDPNKVKKIFKKIGQEMLEVPEFAEDFLQPFKSQGVFEIDDVGMVIRGKFMAKPGKQFVLRKEVFNRVKAAFEENGIDFARREVRVAIPGLDDHKHLDESDKQAIAAAASQAAQEMAEEQAQPASKPGD